MIGFNLRGFPFGFPFSMLSQLTLLPRRPRELGGALDGREWSMLEELLPRKDLWEEGLTGELRKLKGSEGRERGDLIRGGVFRERETNFPFSLEGTAN